MCDKKQYKNNKKTVHCIFASKICQPDYIAKKQAIHRENVQFRTVSQHEQRTNSNINLKFGCRSLDSLFPNGLNSGIIEMVGESGVGKTQLCLQLALMVQLSTERGGLDKKAVFVCTEDAFPSKRLFEIADAFTKRHGEKKYLDNVFIEHVHDAHHLLELVTRRLPILMQKERIGLIVIDSVAGVFRLEADAISRANKMRRLAHALQAVGFDYECAIICINQVDNANLLLFEMYQLTNIYSFSGHISNR